MSLPRRFLRNGVKSAIEMIFRFSVFFFLFIILSHCTTAQKEHTTSVPELKTESLPEDIKLLKEIAQKDPDQSMRAKAYLKLAKLYSSHKNPNLNYQQALKALEMYLSFDPADGGTDEIEDLLAILRAMEKINEENKKSRQKVNQLVRDNKELKESLEQLKNLDIKMEEKRKQIR